MDPVVLAALVVLAAILAALLAVGIACYRAGWNAREADWLRLVTQQQQEAQDALVAPLPADPADEL